MSSWSISQVAEHNSAKSCWVIIKNHVYDVTDFLNVSFEHPGGPSIILKYAGKDATSAYEPIHPPDALEKNLPPSKHMGSLNPDAARTVIQEQQNKPKTKDELRVLAALKQRPPLDHILNLADMEVAFQENSRAFTRFFFHPRVMRPVSQCDPSTTILGFQTSIPVFISGAALAKLGHPQGEANLTRGAAQSNIVQMVSSNASLSYEEIMAASAPSQPLFFQLYKNVNDDIAGRRVRDVERLGYKAIWLTVDALVAGNREKDICAPWQMEEMESGKPAYYVEPTDDTVESTDAGLGTAGALVANDDRDMTWEKASHSLILSAFPHLEPVCRPYLGSGKSPSFPLLSKDAVLAAEAGVEGILISNHGGGIERGTGEFIWLAVVTILTQTIVSLDVVKALCLGARAVGLGRPFLYAQSAYGVPGVVKIVNILRREIITAMRLLGAQSVEDLKPEMVERVDWQTLPRSRL
ncbi:hypothetical protein H0H93_013927 [Arthromyces matolae]|nr:hypothetical protein H0H93_013927 [Arthromyces matolae]